MESDFVLAEKMAMSIMGSEAQVLCCGTVESAEALLEKDLFQIVIADTELPDGDGRRLICDICEGRYISGSAAVIAILPNNKKPDEEKLGRQGVTDYITKPFNMAVLMAKIYTQLSRRKKGFSFKASERFVATGSATKSSIGGAHRVTIDSYVFDFDKSEYSVSGKTVKLSHLEECTLRTLVENKGIVLKKKAFTDWLRCDSKMFVDEAILAGTIQALDEKLDAKDYIKTIFGIGYMWAGIEEKHKERF